MTHIQEVIRLEPSGAVVPAQVVRVRRETDGSTIAAGITDANGEVEYIVDGHPGPYYLHVQDIPGGDKYWHSYDATGAGALTFPEIPYALRALGDGVIPGYENELEVTVTGSSTLSLASGACNVAGHIVVNYLVDNLTVSRPASITRLDRLVCRLYPDTASVTPGLAEFGLLAGNEDGSAVDLTQTSEVYEVGLGIVTVPVAAPISFSDSRSFAGLGTSPVTGVSRDDETSTTSAPGAALSGLSVDLDLSRSTTYDISAELSARQTTLTPITAWALQATYGSTGSGTSPNFDTPSQIAANAAGTAFYIADTANTRVMQIDNTGAYVRNEIYGYDGSDDIMQSISGVSVSQTTGDVFAAYIDQSGNDLQVTRFSSTLVYEAVSATIIAGSSGTPRHMTNNGTNLYLVVVGASVNRVYRLSMSSFGSVTSLISTSGSGTGQLSSPYGIVHYASELYVVDAGNSRVQVFNLSGTYQRQWAIPAGCRGASVDSSGRILVACYTDGMVYRYTSTGTLVDSFTQAGATGITLVTGDIAWVTNGDSDTVTKWDETSSGGGYGEVAVSIDGNVGTYLGLGNEVGAVANSHTRSVAGPASVTVAAYGKATSGTLTLESAVLSATAVPRR
jgi:hypothetical protein